MNDTASTVSVIVPNYRHARFLPQRLDSILKQTVQNLELIILDDASTDGSLDVIARYLDRPHVRFIPNSVNSGDPFSQWNKGLASAKGDYIWIAESDDFAEPDFVESLLNFADRYPTAGIVYCQSDLVDSDSRPVGTLAAHYEGLEAPDRWNADYFASGKDEVVRFLSLRNTIPNASACLFRADLLRRIGGASTGYKLCGDWMTYVRILEHGDIAFCSRTLNHYRIHTDTARNSAERAVLESVETYEVLEFIATHFPIDEQTRLKAAALAFDRLCFLLSKSGTNSIFGWERLARAAWSFDPVFGQRLSNPAAWRSRVAAVYFDVTGTFSEHHVQRVQYPAGARILLRFGPCTGRLRIDPASSEGVVALASVRLLSADDTVIWRADTTTKFQGLNTAGTAIRIPSDLGFVLFAWGDDPIVLLPNLDFMTSEKAYYVEVELEAGPCLRESASVRPVIRCTSVS